MAKRNKLSRAPKVAPVKKEIDKRQMHGNIIRALCTVAVTMVVFCVYRFLLDKHYFEYVLAAYMAIAAIVIFTYVIYNRGFSRRGLTPEMLPDTMTKEQKQEFIEDGERRLRCSRPLLMLIFAFSFTFVYDIIELVTVPFIKEIFGK